MSNKNKDKDNVDESYVKLNLREHVLLKPSMYLGDTSIREEENYIYKNGKISRENIMWSPAFYKIFDEIIVNAYDQTIRDDSMSYIKVTLNKKYIQVKNDGAGIDVVMHGKYKVYIPELIFGNLMTSTNFSPDEERITGGTHGIGAKLTNIFSKKFEIMVKDTKRKLEYRQVFRDNLTIIEKPVIKPYSGDSGGFVVKFYPDFSKFKLKELDDDHYNLFVKRVYDLVGLTKKKIYLNDEKITIKGWDEYLKLYDESIIKYSCNEHWLMGFKLEKNAYQISFVNGIFTNKNGKHIDYIFDQIYDKYSKKIKDLTKRWLKNNITIILKTSIINPTFNSQTKEELMTPYSKFGITCDLDSKFFKLIDEDELINMFKGDNRSLFAKTDGHKKSKLKGIPKLEDANFAGTKKSNDCILILTEGDSAKATAISGISSLKNGRNYYGVFPLKGKLLNVREASIKTINKNDEISNLKKIMGFKSNVVYTKENLGSLRYGSIMLMMDADEDGSHIKGLVLNFLNYFYPSLVKIDGFIKVLITPVVKATYRDKILTFKNTSSYLSWRGSNDVKKYKIKYYKGLGTSTSKEAAEYFTNLVNHTQYLISGKDDIPHPDLELAFNKKLADKRKSWLRQYDMEKRIEFQPEMTIDLHQFIHLEMKHFSNYDNIRSIPVMIDGFKPSQRKVIYACIKRNLFDEIKVAQLSGNVAEVTSYHHGENSLMATIINLAQDFVGSNNLNLLEPIGQFGSRLIGGKDHSSARYIFTHLSKVIKALIKKEDNGLLEYQDDDGFKIEPKVYYPIIPLVLVNGADGIGTGFSTYVPNYNPNDIVNILLNKLKGEKTKIKLKPYYKNFKGDIKYVDANTYVTKGLMELDGNKLYIKELPIKTWTSEYKEFIEELVYESNCELFSSVSNMSSDSEVSFILKIKDETLVKNLMEDKYDEHISKLEKYLKLYKTIKTSNMHLFDKDFDMHLYNSPEKIIDQFYKVRLIKYQERKDLMLKLFKIELELDESKIKWLKMVLSNKVDLQKTTDEELLKILIKNKFAKKDNSYDYLLNISIREMTKDRLDKLKQKIDKIKADIKSLEKKSPEKLWTEDLEELKSLL